MASELTPEQRAAVVAGAELGILLSFGMGAGIGALVAGKGARARGAVIGGVVSVLSGVIVHSLAESRVSEVLKS